MGTQTSKLTGQRRPDYGAGIAQSQELSQTRVSISHAQPGKKRKIRFKAVILFFLLMLRDMSSKSFVIWGNMTFGIS